MARIPLPTRDDLPDEQARERWDRIAARGPILNIIRLYFANPELESNGIRAWRASGLPTRSRELVILRCAFRRQSRYEWHQHVRFARDAGIPGADINAIRNWENSSSFSPEERVLLRYADALVDSARPDDEVFAAVAEGRSSAEVLGITYLITYYLQAGHVMAAMDLETEEPFVGWEI
jgi:alkylhydroperoxidase family enzyme